MTTRGSLARGQGQQQFHGNVQKWVRQWVEPGTGPGSSKVALLKWVPTGDRSGSKPGPRFPHLQPVSNANLKVPAGNKHNGKKPSSRQHELSQPAAMDVDGGQPVPASKLQLVETLSAEVNASTARDTNGKAHTAPEHKVTQGATELPVQEPPAATSQHAAGALFDRRDMEATPDEGRSSADVAAEPTQVSNSHADTAPQRLAAPAVDLASPQAAPASGLAPEAQQPAAELQPRQDNIHDSTQELQHATAAETGNVADDKLPVPASLGDEAPGQAPAGRDDRMLTGRQAPGQTPAGRDDEALTGPGAPDQTPCGRDDAALAGHDAPDQAMAADWDRTLAGDEAQTSEGDEVLTGPGLPSGEPDQAPISTATETAASAAASESAVQQQQPAPGALSGPPSLNEQPQVHSEAAVAVSTPAKRPVEGVGEGMEPDAKRAKAQPGVEHPR